MRNTPSKKSGLNPDFLDEDDFYIFPYYIQLASRDREIMNQGMDQETVQEYKARISAGGKRYVVDDEDESSEEFAHFYFIGMYEGKEVIYDTVLYTLRLQHESELFEIAEHRAAKHFPQYKKIAYAEDENGNLETLDAMQEEIGLFMAEVIMELEEDETVKVKEHIDLDDNADFGIGLDVGLHVPEITHDVITKFITNFNDDTIVLDETLYSFQTQDETL